MTLDSTRGLICAHVVAQPHAFRTYIRQLAAHKYSMLDHNKLSAVAVARASY